MCPGHCLGGRQAWVPCRKGGRDRVHGVDGGGCAARSSSRTSLATLSPLFLIPQSASSTGRRAGPQPLPQKTVVFKKKQKWRRLPTAGVSCVPRPGGGSSIPGSAGSSRGSGCSMLWAGRELLCSTNQAGTGQCRCNQSATRRPQSHLLQEAPDTVRCLMVAAKV